MPDELSETRFLAGLDDRAARQKALADLFTSHRRRLRLLVDLRLDRRLRGVVDPSDVLQEAFLVASRRLDAYAADPKVPLFLWLRFITGQKIHEIHDLHLGVQKRDERRKVSLDGLVVPEASSVALADRLGAEGSSPSEAAIRGERLERVRKAIEGLDPIDREILALRFYESLSSAEAARVLGIKEDTARKRYLRSMKRLKEVLEAARSGGSHGRGA